MSWKRGWIERAGYQFDRVIKAFAPGWAWKRAQAKAAAEVFSAYRGGASNRLRKDWVPGAGSADADLLPDLASMRERSRDLNRNDPHAAGITGTVTVNTIGTGIKAQSRLDREGLGITEAQARAFQTRAERAFQRWMRHADAENRMDFFELQALVDRQILESGEAVLIPLMLERPPHDAYTLDVKKVAA